MKSSSVLAIVGDATPFAPIIEWIRRRTLAVQVVTTGTAGLAAHADGGATLVIVGLPLTDTSAAALLSGLRAQDPSATILTCGRDDDIDGIHRALELGATEHVADAHHRRDLSFAIGMLLGLRDGDVQLRVERDRELATIRWDAIVGTNAAMRTVLDRVRELCERPHRRSVMLVGELGTGKRLLAKCLHYNGLRRGRTFLQVSCSTVPRDDLREHLFGRERPSRRGVFEIAAGGTLLLDEVGAIPHELQEDLVRAIEHQCIRRVGGTAEIPIDVHVIATTRRDLTSMVRRGELREDLYHRLSVVRIDLPPLRERKEDIPALTEAMLRSLAAEHGIAAAAMSVEALAELGQRSWPGNLRELRNELEHLLVLVDDEVIRPHHLRGARGDTVSISTGENADLVVRLVGERFPLRQIERDVVRHTLVRSGGNLSRCARLLGMSRSELIERIGKLGLETGVSALPDSLSQES